MQLADKYAVTGWVRNRSDGRVEMIAEGEESELKKLLADVDLEMKEFIQYADLAWQAATNEHQSFVINPTV